MSPIEMILSRMMTNADFAKAVFADAEKALTEYDLSIEEIKKFKGISRAQFDAMTANPDERKSFSLAGQTIRIRIGTTNNSGKF